MAYEPQTLRPRVSGRYRYKWHSAAFLATVFTIATVALATTIVSSRASSTPLLDNHTMSAAREQATNKLPKQIPLATAGDLQLMLPIFEQQVTAVGFHPIDDSDALTMSPIGRQGNGSFISSLGDMFSQSGPEYYVLGDGGKLGSALRAMVVGAPAGTVVYSPVDGTIAGIKSYQIRGQCPDVEIEIKPQASARLLVVLTHIDQPVASLGQPVRAGVTKLGAVRQLDGCIQQPLGDYTYDNGNNLRVQVESTH